MPLYDTVLPGNAIRIAVGANAQALVNAAPEGATFFFESGVHRLVSITPKNGQTFLGDEAAVVSGARLLTGFAQDGNAWVIGGQTQQGERRSLGEMQPGFDNAGFPDVVFMDNKPLEAVDTRAELGAGKYYFDYAADRIYLGDNPAGRVVEAAVSPYAFAGPATDVTIHGLTVEKYASPIQFGAIGYRSPPVNWTVENNEVRLNFGVGITVGDNSKIIGNYVHSNGQMGLGGNGDNILVFGNEIAANGFWSGTDVLWEGGGTKFADSTGLVVRGNYSHDNNGYGLWTDIDVVNTLYEYNRLERNSTGGINHEISFDAVIRNNSFADNGAGKPEWLWGAAIQVQNSRNVEIYGNSIDMAVAGNGISMIQQDRGGGPLGQYLVTGNNVHDNVVVARDAGSGASGGVADALEGAFLAGGNVSDRNIYYHANPTNDNWAWGDLYDWGTYRTISGQERNSQLLTVTSQTPLASDILATRDGYGAGSSIGAGDTTYGFNNTSGRQVFDFTLNPNPFVTIYDVGGVNTLDLSGFVRGNRVDLNSGAYSDVGGFMTNNLRIGIGTNIQRAVGGSGDDSIVGSGSNNTLEGNAGDDILNGRAGDDTLLGGGGNDSMVGGAGNDMLTGGTGSDVAVFTGARSQYTVVRNAGTGIVTVTDNTASRDGTDLLQADVERLRFSDADYLASGFGFGATPVLSIAALSADKAEGNAGLTPSTFTVTRTGDTSGASSVAWAVAGAGANAFDFAGSVLLSGTVNFAAGETSRTVTVNVLADSIQEADEGFTVTLSAPTGGTLGTASANGIIRNDDAAPGITGTVGNDTISPSGASTGVTGGSSTAGSDTISGLAGNDFLDSGAGNDSLDGGEGNDNLNGGTGNDRLIGGIGADTLNGGLGADSKAGGAGDDTYELDNAGDVLLEQAGGGYDRVVASISYTLGSEVERLSLSGTANLNGTGNALANWLDGNAAANTLDGGLGADRKAGGAGNDTYLVDNIGDVVVELSGGGNDRIGSAITWTLGDNAERLTLRGSADLNGTGNALGNQIDGNGGANFIEGREGNDVLFGAGGNDTLLGGAGVDVIEAGLGNDSMQGGTQADRFVFRSAAEANGDVITDFSVADGDTIDLRPIDTNPGLAGDQAFVWIGSASFSSVAGELRFDAGVLAGDVDGNGLADFQLSLSGVAVLTAANIWL